MDIITIARNMLPLYIERIPKQVPLQYFAKKFFLHSGLHPLRMKRKHAPQQIAPKTLSNIWCLKSCCVGKPRSRIRDSSTRLINSESLLSVEKELPLLKGELISQTEFIVSGTQVSSFRLVVWFLAKYSCSLDVIVSASNGSMK